MLLGSGEVERDSDRPEVAAEGPSSGGSPREGARSEERAKQRLAAGGRRLPRPGLARAAQVRAGAEEIYPVRPRTWYLTKLVWTPTSKGCEPVMTTVSAGAAKW